MTKILSVKERIAFWAARETAPGTSLKGNNRTGVTIISNSSINQTTKSTSTTPKLTTTTSTTSITSASSSELRGIDSPKSISIISSPTSSPPLSPRSFGSSLKPVTSTSLTTASVATSTPTVTANTTLSSVSTVSPSVTTTPSFVSTTTTTTAPDTLTSPKESLTSISSPLINNVAASNTKDFIEPPPITTSYSSVSSSSSSSASSGTAGPGNVLSVSNPLFDLTPRYDQQSSSSSLTEADKLVSTSSSLQQEINQLLKEVNFDTPNPNSLSVQTPSPSTTATVISPPIAIVKQTETKVTPSVSISPPQERKEPSVPVIVSNVNSTANNTAPLSPSSSNITLSSLQLSTSPPTTSSTAQPKSLQDIQAAMRRAEQQKKEAQERRANLATPAYAKGRRLSKAERRTIRETRRMTIVDQKVQVEKKIDDFIKILTGFQAMLDKEREETKKTIERLELVTSLLTLANTELDLMKGTIDRIVEDYTKKHSTKTADSEYYQELVKFQEQFWELRHKFHIQVAKGTKELRAQDGEPPQGLPIEKSHVRSDSNNVSNIPVPPPSPKFQSRASVDPKTGKLIVTPFSAFLEQIQRGVALKKVEYEKIRKEKEERIQQSVNTAHSLQRMLREALDARAMFLECASDSDEEEEDLSTWK